MESWARDNCLNENNNNVLTGVRRVPDRSLTNPITGPAWRFIISCWICEGSSLEISEEGKGGSGFLPHSRHASSSSSSNTSSNSSGMWTLRFPARAKWEFADARRRRRRRVGTGWKVMGEERIKWGMMHSREWVFWEWNVFRLWVCDFVAA